MRASTLLPTAFLASCGAGSDYQITDCRALEPMRAKPDIVEQLLAGAFESGAGEVDCTGSGNLVGKSYHNCGLSPVEYDDGEISQQGWGAEMSSSLERPEDLCANETSQQRFFVFAWHGDASSENLEAQAQECLDGDCSNIHLSGLDESQSFFDYETPSSYPGYMTLIPGSFAEGQEELSLLVFDYVDTDLNVSFQFKDGLEGDLVWGECATLYPYSGIEGQYRTAYDGSLSDCLPEGASAE